MSKQNFVGCWRRAEKFRVDGKGAAAGKKPWLLKTRMNQNSQAGRLESHAFYSTRLLFCFFDLYT